MIDTVANACTPRQTATVVISRQPSIVEYRLDFIRILIAIFLRLFLYYFIIIEIISIIFEKISFFWEEDI